MLDTLLDLTYTVDPAYRAGASFMACDDTTRQARRFKDSLGRPLWQPSLEEGVPDKFAGYPDRRKSANAGHGREREVNPVR